MCGIAGFYNKNRKDYQRDIKAMCDAMKNRGLDAYNGAGEIQIGVSIWSRMQSLCREKRPAMK